MTSEAAGAQPHAMLGYIIRRLLWTPVLLLLVSAVVFTLGHLGPGDPVRVHLGRNYTEEAAERLREAYGLDDPLHVRFVRYVWDAARGDFGESLQFQGRSVASLLAPRLITSAQLFLAGSVITVGVGVPLGFLAAVRQGRWLDPAIVSGTLVLYALPVFVTAPVLIVVFGLWLDWLPVSGWGGLLDTRAVLPAVTAGTPGIAVFARMMRASTLEVLGQDYIRTARAKGLSEAVIAYRHIGRNALIPVLTLFGFSLAALLGGALIVELIYGIPGVARFALDAIFARDYPVIMAISLVGAATLALANLLVDILYALADPRIRYD